MRAVGYYRPPQPTYHSAASGQLAQSASARAEIERYCAEEFHHLVEFFGVGAERGPWATSDAEQFEALLDFLTGDNARPALVVIPDAAHMASDLETLVERLLTLEAVGAEVRCAEPDVPDPLHNGLDRLGLEGRSAERARSIRGSILSKAARGEVLGRTPYGYSAGVDGLLRPVPEEAAVVENIFEWYAGETSPNGSGGEPETKGPGLRRIAAILNEGGFRTRKRNPWTPVALATILRNRVYLGTYSRLGIRLAGNHPALVESRVFNRAQQLLADRRPRRRRSQAEPFLLGGLARCGVCGRGVHGLTRSRTWRRRDGTSVSRTYRYYECPSRARSRGRADVPQHPSWRADRLEAAALERIGRDAGERREAPLTAGPGRGRSAEIARAEREFMRALRKTTSGGGRISSLAGPLETLRSVRDSPPSEAGRQQKVGDWLSDLRCGEQRRASRALRALVERIVVTERDVEVAFRF